MGLPANVKQSASTYSASRKDNFTIYKKIKITDKKTLYF